MYKKYNTLNIPNHIHPLHPTSSLLLFPHSCISESNLPNGRIYHWFLLSPPSLINSWRVCVYEREDPYLFRTFHIYVVLSNDTATLLLQATANWFLDYDNHLLTDSSASSLFQFNHSLSHQVTFLNCNHDCVNPLMSFLIKILQCSFILIIKSNLLNMVTRPCKIYSVIMAPASGITTSFWHSKFQLE